MSLNGRACQRNPRATSHLSKGSRAAMAPPAMAVPSHHFGRYLKIPFLFVVVRALEVMASVLLASNDVPRPARPPRERMAAGPSKAPGNRSVSLVLPFHGLDDDSSARSARSTEEGRWRCRETRAAAVAVGICLSGRSGMWRENKFHRRFFQPIRPFLE